MLIDSLAQTLARSGALSGFWDSLDGGNDATLAVASSARPFVVAARMAARPQPTLVVVSGEEAAVAFARNLAAYLGPERVLRFCERTDYPFSAAAAAGQSTGAGAIDARLVARRTQAAWALLTRRAVCVVASAGALVRKLPPAAAGAVAPLELVAGCDLCDMPGAQNVKGTASDTFGTSHLSAYAAPATFDQLERALVERGYKNTGELAGPGTFCVRGGTIDVFAGNMVFPVRLDFFGDELEEIRRIVPLTGQTISSLKHVEIFPVTELAATQANARAAQKSFEARAQLNSRFAEIADQLAGGLNFDGAEVFLPEVYPKLVTLGDYVPQNALVALVEPRAVMDSATRVYDEACARAAGTGFAGGTLYAAPADLDFGACQHATFVSIMRAGASVDAELPVKRSDVAGAPDRLFEKMQGWLSNDFTCVFSAPNARARHAMALEFVERGMSVIDLADPAQNAQDAEGPEGSVGVNSRLSAVPEAKPSGAAENEAAIRDAEGVTGAPGVAASSDALVSDTFATANTSAKAARLKRGVVNITDVEIPLGMVIPAARLAMISVADTQGARAAGRKHRQLDMTKITFPYAPGDYVVHAVFGVAHFKRLVAREIDGCVRDYLELEYAEGDKLYLPVEQLDRVTRYVGAEGSTPRLTRLNTSDWQKSVSRARRATKKLAFDLVDVYTRRSATAGFAFDTDMPQISEMEAAFPYDETPDQLRAIADVKDDMASARPMDRLVCGDVGFGKTEVAMRAAMICAVNKRQVMVLCPTTILAQQHFNSFSERLAPFGVTVDVLSRFKTPAEQARSLDAFAKGKLDVLIGTHRLLSRDVNPAQLGLVIIDEEQRFGVGHKEQFKNMRESVDVLTLSATPIPRTMQMAVSGVREMSLIMTPPGQRKPIKVHVGEWDPDIVAAAIRRELDRKGQLYYVSNRVRTIDDAVARVVDAAPEARVGVVHGKMNKDEIERVMEDFSAGTIDVLVATTIVESGIDNPHTNTLIIEDSQRLGLAQMYQLKGRVGRSSAQAYAYFMFPEEVPLTPEAEARLIALDEHQELGAGMQIALRDLEIRGAGSMLGAEQSGNLSSVGFDLFAQMLNEAVACAREGASVDENGLPPALSDITINIGGSAFLSEDFIPDTDARVLAYRQLACAASLEAVEEIAHALAAAHGELPPEAAQLISRSRLKVLCAEHGVASITNAAGYVHFEPVDLHAPKQAELRRQGARYVKDKRKLSVPARSLVAADAQVSYASVFEFLQDIYNVSSQDDSRAAAHTVASCASYSSRKAAKSAPKAASKGGEGVTGAPKRAAKPSARGQVTHSPTPAPAKSASAQPNAARSLSAARTEQKAQAKAARQAARAEAAGARAASAHTRAGLHTGKSANVHDATVGSVRTTKTNPRKRKRSL